MRDASILEDVERYYSGKFAEHGATAQGVDWNSPESQELRFRQLLRVAEPFTDGFSLVDYGCGYGALVGFLDENRLRYSYQGFDVSRSMLEHAGQKYGGRPERQFTSDASALRPADLAIASGIFNVRLSVDDDRWLGYVLETIDRLDELGTRGFAFNMFTSYSDPERMRPELYYGDPRFFFDRCKRDYTRNVALLHDYELYEFTIIARK
jgi:SAM-dependent methyltransferase